MLESSWCCEHAATLDEELVAAWFNHDAKELVILVCHRFSRLPLSRFSAILAQNPLGPCAPRRSDHSFVKKDRSVDSVDWMIRNRDLTETYTTSTSLPLLHRTDSTNWSPAAVARSHSSTPGTFFVYNLCNSVSANA